MSRPTLEELQDRFEVDELLTRYAYAIDDREFDLLDSVFTPDARIDYTSAGGIAGAYPEIKAWLSEILPMFSAYQHVVGNRRVVLDGDTGTAVSAFFNPMAMNGEISFFCGGEYHDRLVRTADGWRIAERVERTVWNWGVPA